MAKYKLTRLPDVDRKINWKWERETLNIPRKLISFDWNWLREEAAKLEVGESKIYEVKV